jgi:hypothetical protein
LANFVFNRCKGRVAELYNRVQIDDPAASTLVVVVLLTTGLETDSTLMDYDLLSTLLAGTSNEATNTGYARKVLTQAVLSAITPDDTAELMAVDIPDQTWTGVAVSPGAWSKLLICYDPSSSGVTDSVIVPMTAHDFLVTPDTGDITAVIANGPPAGFFKAS